MRVEGVKGRLMNLAAMRVLNEQAQRYRQRERDHLPLPGRVGWGGADAEWRLRALIWEAYLAGLRKGLPAPDCLEVAKREGLYALSRWNEVECRGRACAGGRVTLHHSKDSIDQWAWDCHRAYLREEARNEGVDRPDQ